MKWKIFETRRLSRDLGGRPRHPRGEQAHVGETEEETAAAVAAEQSGKSQESAALTRETITWVDSRLGHTICTSRERSLTGQSPKAAAGQRKSN